jgi:hypothetical protein
MQALQRDQSQEIETLLAQYQEMVASLPEQADRQSRSRLAPIETTIAAVRSDIDLISKSIASTSRFEEDYPDDSAIQTERMQTGRISDLQRQILRQNSERAADLNNAKQQMNRCVHALEELETHFLSQSQNLTKRLDIMDGRYRMNLEKVRDQRQHRIQILEERLKTAKMKWKSTVRLLRKTEKNREETIAKGIREMEIMRAGAVRDRPFAESGDEFAELQGIRGNYGRWVETMERKTDALENLRTENDRLKREIGRIKFEVRYGNRP